MKVSVVSDGPTQHTKFDFITGETEKITKIDDEIIADAVPDNTTFSVGEWVLVAFPGKKLVKYFVGQIVDTCGLSVITVKFLRFDKDSKKFSWPEADDISDIDLYDNSAEKISEPAFDNRRRYTFSGINFENKTYGIKVNFNFCHL